MRNKISKFTAIFIIQLFISQVGFCQNAESNFSSGAAAIERLVNSKVDLGLKIRSGKVPEYPASARRHEIQGTVVFIIKIDKKGYVDDFRVISSPHELLSLSVRSAARNWFFEPLIVNGEPSEIEITAQYVFFLLP
ncbi:energy transducer TonB [Massilia sp. CCM 9210]|uniref:energy transducer TonB n=1 Tax=Massilia scottii TaxID=3057166 RepID=UPI002796A38F|nr:energy transducer TonB [Massilia sp. CCM 9210]MDQ1814300.1 energy transducer TonB [Massilia sp. CCM 9210]